MFAASAACSEPIEHTFSTTGVIFVDPLLAAELTSVSGSFTYDNGVVSSGSTTGGSALGSTIYRSLSNLSGDANGNSFSDSQARAAFKFLLNAIEQLVAENQQSREHIQKLKDEINRLKGEQGKPTIRAQKKDGDISSEKERKKKKKAKKKRSKKKTTKVDRVEHCPVDRSILPDDATSKGVETILVQDIVIQAENIEFRREVFYGSA